MMEKRFTDMYEIPPAQPGAGRLPVTTANLLLLAATIIWGFGFVAQRMGMEHVGPFTFNGLRFLLGGLWLLPLVIFTSRGCSEKRFRLDPLTTPENRTAMDRVAILPRPRPGLAAVFCSLVSVPRQATISVLRAGWYAGLLLFCGASLQQVGLLYTTAGKAGFITDLYVILVPVFGLFFGQRTSRGTWIGALLATAGMYLLSFQGHRSINPGDLLVLAGSVFWALHVLLLAYFSPRTHPLGLAMTQFLICALLNAIIAIPLERPTWAEIQAASGPIVYGGLCSVGIGYTLQVIGQRWTHPSHAAILLSLEAVFAALAGWWLLGEVLTSGNVLGCCLMLGGMLWSQLAPRRQLQERGSAN